MLLLGLLLIIACTADEKNNSGSIYNTQFAANVIYGLDGRLDLYQISDDRLRGLADSTVALVRTNELVAGTDDLINLNVGNYGAIMNLCPTEKYREQNSVGFCSGSLITPDIILTAGHCVDTQSKCDDTAFIFGYAIKTMGDQPKTVSAHNVYHCKEIIKSIRITDGADFALIKLDRLVSGYKPLLLRLDGEASINDPLTVIGNPGGLPTKIAAGGKVRNISADFFQANLDAYGGSSGSAVFNSESGLIEGVLVRGEMDFEHQGTCRVSKICTDDSCRGEDVTKISAIRPFIPASY